MKEYIGDGVYAEHDGFGVWLTTQRESGEHRIYLEAAMLDRLSAIMRRGSFAEPAPAPGEGYKRSLTHESPGEE